MSPSQLTLNVGQMPAGGVSRGSEGGDRLVLRSTAGSTRETDRPAVQPGGTVFGPPSLKVLVYVARKPVPLPGASW